MFKYIFNYYRWNTLVLLFILILKRFFLYIDVHGSMLEKRLTVLLNYAPVNRVYGTCKL